MTYAAGNTMGYGSVAGTSAAAAPARRRWTEALAAVLVIGYLCMARVFAYYGVPPLYVGEMAIVVLLVGCRDAIVRYVVGGLYRESPLTTLDWSLYLFVGFGLVQALRGYWAGYEPIILLQNLVFHVYPVFFFFGLRIGAANPQFLGKLVRWLAWTHGVYGVVYIIVLSPLGLAGDAEQMGMFGQPCGAGIAILALLALEPRLRSVWIPLLLNSFVLLGVQVRAEWLAFGVAMAALAWLSGQLDRLLRVTAVVGGLVILAAFVDFRIPAPMSRGGEISARGIVGRAVAAVDPEGARSIVRDAEVYSSTVSWRTEWWGAICDKVHEAPQTTLFGPGYGYPIWYLHPEANIDRPVRTPHNIWMHALGYTGWFGVVIAAAFFLALGGLLWRVFRETGQPLGFCLWVFVMCWAPFDCYLETPYGAIPTYLLIGLAAAPAIASTGAGDRSGAVEGRPGGTRTTRNESA